MAKPPDGRHASADTFLISKLAASERLWSARTFAFWTRPVMRRARKGSAPALRPFFFLQRRCRRPAKPCRDCTARVNSAPTRTPERVRRETARSPNVLPKSRNSPGASGSRGACTRDYAAHPSPLPVTAGYRRGKIQDDSLAGWQKSREAPQYWV